MINFNEYINASEIWPSAKNYEDKGPKSNLVRGYNVEVAKLNGEKHWWSCEWIHNDPNSCFNDDFHTFMYDQYNVKPTGRICFRGYGEEFYIPEERDYGIRQVEI